MLRAGKRAAWTASAAGVYALDPDADGGPAIECASSDGVRRARTVLPGDPDAYMEPLAGTALSLAVSPDGRWVVYLHQDTTERKIMLVEDFR